MREVAITVWPWDCTSRVRRRPKPDEQPVMSQVSLRSGVVNVGVDMLCLLRLGMLWILFASGYVHLARTEANTLNLTATHGLLKITVIGSVLR